MSRDASGEMGIGVASGPDDTVRIMGEADQSSAGRYIRVKSLTFVNWAPPRVTPLGMPKHVPARGKLAVDVVARPKRV